MEASVVSLAAIFILLHYDLLDGVIFDSIQERLYLDEIVVALLAGFVMFSLREAFGLRKMVRAYDEAVQALHNSREVYQHIVENATEIIFRVDDKGLVSFANATAERIMGYPLKELIGRPYLDFVQPEYRQTVRRFFAVQVSRKTTTSYYEAPGIAKDGTVIWFGQFVRLLIRGERVVGLEVISRDVTERRRVEEELKKSVDQLQKALSEVRTLSGMLPICASCKKIRDDEGYWSQIEAYVETHTHAQFSHGMCPDCLTVFFPKSPSQNRQSLKDQPHPGPENR